MYGLLMRTWWIVLARGASATAFGVALLVWPRLPLTVLALSFGAFALVDGTLSIVSAAVGGRRDAWVLLTEGTGGIVPALVALSWPAITTATLLVIVAAWCAVRGGAELWTARRLHRHCPNEPTLVGAAVTVLVSCIVLVAHPGQGPLDVERIAGAAAVAAGALLILFAARLWLWLRTSHHLAALVVGDAVRSGRERAA
jgi:uncharacterized membrane protein HdeD (DUF308 family)